MSLFISTVTRLQVLTIFGDDQSYQRSTLYHFKNKDEWGLLLSER
ncbi:hypothetical protein QW060_25360 [Myroides ceti]|uniref:Uncharacterized protein n=1 Tax=Paenimyroides ceti TaxID=395087 RepID=A0ABT8D1F9_9FLAO|nr:hypothetical protein [Paenimyroides ceti]MDN3710201.1 hypothetical protein [Paenimyroides ceti]